MRTRHLLAAIGLVSILGACVTPSTPLPTNNNPDTSTPSKSNQAPSSGTSSGLSSDTAAGTSSAASCELNDTQPTRLTTPDNTPVFEQFNFRPIEISTGGDSVTITTAHHIFSLCESNGQWSIASANAAEDEAPFNYTQLLADMAAPSYDTIELNGKTFEYRIRLQAEWLAEQLKPETIDPEATPPEEIDTLAVATEDAVFFELKTPEGELISEQLYTVSELQEAGLGASLGAPNIADAIATRSDIWFGASASQGEGDSGFASLIRYDAETEELSVERPDTIQGSQITSLAVTGADTADSDTPLTLWMGTQRSGEGVPYFPSHGLVAYQPSTQALTTHTVANSPLIGAIPGRLAVKADQLWSATGDGVCQISWPTIDQTDSWTCWRFTATAALPPEGIDLYQSFLAQEPATQLKEKEVEILWLSQSFDTPEDELAIRYEAVYKPGFEVQLSQGGYRIANSVAQRAAGGNEIFWPGNQWHWAGDRFRRSLDEVALNLVGGGPRGLVASNGRGGFNLDNYAIRGEFDLLELTDDATKVRYYSGWIEGDEVDVYPTVVPVETTAKDMAKDTANPLTEMAAKLTATQGP